MNCDRVFDILTRGPFPSGAPSDERVERHLSQCGSCRRLAAALQPAIELFEEAITPDEGRDLPAYWGDLFLADQDDSGLHHGSSWRGGTSTRLATRLRRATGLDLATVRRTLPTAWRLSAAVLLGVCIGGLLRSADLGASSSITPLTSALNDAPSNDIDNSVDKTAGAVPPRVALAELRLVACAYAEGQPARFIGLTKPAEEAEHPHAALHSQQLACCTDCHNSANERLQIPRDTTALIAHTCTSCHTD